MLALIRALQRRASCHLGGGAASSGAHSSHRLSGDVDLFCHEPGDVRQLVRELPTLAAECALEIAIVRDVGTFVRALVRGPDGALDLDLVDLLFLGRAGFPPEHDLPLALQKDAGIDPGVLAWLLGQFPTQPLPMMLEPLAEEELIRFRNDLRERLHRLAVPEG